MKATLEQEWDVAAGERRKLEAELEGALDELSALEAQEHRGLGELLNLQGCNQELKTELDHATDQINRSEVKFVVMVIF